MNFVERTIVEALKRKFIEKTEYLAGSRRRINKNGSTRRRSIQNWCKKTPVFVVEDKENENSRSFFCQNRSIFCGLQAVDTHAGCQKKFWKCCLNDQIENENINLKSLLFKLELCSSLFFSRSWTKFSFKLLARLNLIYNFYFDLLIKTKHQFKPYTIEYVSFRFILLETEKNSTKACGKKNCFQYRFSTMLILSQWKHERTYNIIYTVHVLCMLIIHVPTRVPRYPSSFFTINFQFLYKFFFQSYLFVYYFIVVGIVGSCTNSTNNL